VNEVGFLFVVATIVVMGFSFWCALRAYQRGHKLLFVVGIFFPPAWWVGAFLPPPKPGAWI
jgi:hypothetical protein